MISDPPVPKGVNMKKGFLLSVAAMARRRRLKLKSSAAREAREHEPPLRVAFSCASKAQPIFASSIRVKGPENG